MADVNWAEDDELGFVEENCSLILTDKDDRIAKEIIKIFKKNEVQVYRARAILNLCKRAIMLSSVG